MISKCGSCGAMCQKIASFKRRSGTTVFINERGKQWSGRTCPGCKNRNRRLASDLQTGLGPRLDIDPITDRKCRVCFKPLPTSRYFQHDACDTKGEVPYGIDDFGIKSHGVLTNYVRSIF